MNAISSPEPTSSAPAGNGQTYRMPFTIMTILFFMWGFMTVWNDILIPRFKEAFTLNYFEAMLIQFAWGVAYTVGALVYYLISMFYGDPINRIGYKNGVIIGLLFAASGSALFFPAASLSPRAAMITSGDIQNVRVLGEQLSQPTNAVSLFVAGKLSDQTHQLLATGAKVDEQKLRENLAANLNELVKGPVIYEQQRFAEVKLSKPTADLVEKWNTQQLKGTGSTLLNRALLEDAYPHMVNKNYIPYVFFLVAFFIVGLGFAMLQIAANPYVTILGPEVTASSRLNLSQAFNSFGTTIGPIIGGWLIFTVFNRPGTNGADSVKVPYLCFAGVFLFLAVFFKFAHLPNFTNKDHISRGAGPLKYPHTVLGMIAIFMYVGGEVTVGSTIINYLGLPKLGGLNHETASQFLAFYWGGLMVGRFMGAFALSNIRKHVRHMLVVLTPVAAFIVILTLPHFAAALHLGWAASAAVICSPGNAAHYGALLLLLLVAFFLGEASAHRMLALFSAVIIGLLLTGVLTSGETAKWAILGVGLFCSVMWSNIFSLAIEGLGPLKSQASSLLIMAVLGFALVPPLQGLVADRMGIQFSFVVPMVAFAYITFYGIYGYRAGRQKTSCVI